MIYVDPLADQHGSVYLHDFAGRDCAGSRRFIVLSKIRRECLLGSKRSRGKLKVSLHNFL